MLNFTWNDTRLQCGFKPWSFNSKFRLKKLNYIFYSCTKLQSFEQLLAVTWSNLIVSKYTTMSYLQCYVGIFRKEKGDFPFHCLLYLLPNHLSLILSWVKHLQSQTTVDIAVSARGKNSQFTLVLFIYMSYDSEILQWQHWKSITLNSTQNSFFYGTRIASAIHPVITFFTLTYIKF